MSNSSADLFEADIPGSSFTARGGEFYIVATDDAGKQTRQPAAANTYFPIIVEIQAPGLQSTLHSGDQQSDYRLVSVPLNLSNPASSNVLSSLGQYDNTKWRLWSLKDNYLDFQGEARFNELTNGTTFSPGSAYFLITDIGGSLQTSSATTISTAAPFTKQLHEGWNFISNPFNFNIPTSAISVDNQSSPQVQSFTGGWIPLTELRPFQGYIVNASSDNSILTIDPNLSPVAGKTSTTPNTHAITSKAEWSIQIDAKSGDYFDTYNLIGVSTDASPDWDHMDRPEPPQFDDFLSVYFPRDNWESVHAQFETDFRPDLPDGDIWDFEVKGAPLESVELNFSGLENVPAHKSVHLVDTFTGVSQDLRIKDSYQFLLPDSQEPRSLQLVVGLSDYVEDHIEEHSLLPESVVLDQNYPNPFNPTTSIRYGVFEDMVVSLKVYNVLGQLVSVLVDNELKKPGYHISYWNALTENGSAVPSGLYIYELQVSPANSHQSTHNHATLTRKMLLIK